MNQSILRAHFPISKIEKTLGQLNGTKFFSKVNATSGFYQIKLSEEDQSLTTFITPFGHFKFIRLFFEVSSTPKYDGLKLSKIRVRIDRVILHMDDILVFASTLKEHHQLLDKVVTRIHSKSITLNKHKCVFGVNSVKFLEHTISDKGINIDRHRIRES